MRKSTQIIFSILAILFSVNLYGASESAETFRYGPAYLTDYIPASGLIYDFSFPEWIEGVWWAAYYSDTETQNMDKGLSSCLCRLSGKRKDLINI